MTGEGLEADHAGKLRYELPTAGDLSEYLRDDVVVAVTVAEAATSTPEAAKSQNSKAKPFASPKVLGI